MSIKKKWKAAGLVWSLLAVVVPAQAITLSVEKDDGVSGMAAPVPAVPTPGAGRPSGRAQNQTPFTGQEGAPEKRVRINDKVGFYSFVSSGFAVDDPSKLRPVGRVVGGPDQTVEFAYPNKTYVEMTDGKEAVEPGDLFVVCRAQTHLSAPPVGMKGYQVENLAVVRVLEVQRRRCLVEITSSFGIFHRGDWVVPYDRELRRWEKARTKKPLPDHPIKAYVLGGVLGKWAYDQTDFIFISAGEKDGVVEGQTFQLREYEGGNLLEEGMHVPAGTAQVIYAGPEVSTALILRNSRSIHKGFEADYRP
jgi:hypothetical protein